LKQIPKSELSKGPIREMVRSSGHLGRSLVGELDGLERFLSLKAHNLLIKGLPGTGKTTLALQLLNYFGKDNGLYISSRVPREKLAAQISWLPDAIGAKDNDFKDVRLADTESFVQTIFGAIESGRRKRGPRVIALDTWDSMAKEMDPEERLKTEKTLIAFGDQSKTRLVFVSEEPGATTIDYLVDGVVELTRKEESDRIFREIEVLKLRGTPIVQHKYLFTLLNSQFQYIKSYETPDYDKVKPLRAIQDKQHGYSFGSKDIDAVFGELRKGGTFTIEYNELVPYSIVRTIEMPAVANFLLHGRSVFLIPLPGASSEELLRLTEKAMGRTRESLEQWLDGRLKILSMESNSDSVSLKDTVAQQSKEIRSAIEKLSSKSKDKTVLIVECLSLVENKFATDINALVEAISTSVSRVQESNNAMIFLLQSDSPIKSRILAMSYDFGRIIMKDRSPVLLGLKRNSGVYAIQHSPENELLPELKQIL
jgi:KaiC/GvpD/RAD55 family RecA-like ATPase